MVDVCDYDNKSCRNYYSNLNVNSDQSTGDFLSQRPFGFNSNYEIIELGYDYIIVSSLWNRSWDNYSGTQYILMKGYDEGVSFEVSSNLEVIYQLINQVEESNELFISDGTDVFEDIDEMENCEVSFYNNSSTIGCDNIFIF